MNYLNYNLPNSEILKIIKKRNIDNIIIYIDLKSIAHGFFNKDLIKYELDSFLNRKQKPIKFLLELKNYISNLYNVYKEYNIKFIIFYDDSVNKQNIDICKRYKSERPKFDNFLNDDEQSGFKQIKKYYFDEINNNFKIKDVCKILYIKDYETDFMPYFVLQSKLLDCDKDNTLNVVLSIDKDLLQCCEFNNTIQVVKTYKRSIQKTVTTIYDKKNAINYLIKNYDFEEYKLTADYITMILSLAGDKSDTVDGVPGVGYISAVKLISNQNIPCIINENYEFKDKLEKYKEQIYLSYQLVSFSEQIKRIPLKIHQQMINLINE